MPIAALNTTKPNVISVCRQAKSRRCDSSASPGLSGTTRKLCRGRTSGKQATRHGVVPRRHRGVRTLVVLKAATASRFVSRGEGAGEGTRSAHFPDSPTLPRQRIAAAACPQPDEAAVARDRRSGTERRCRFARPVAYDGRPRRGRPWPNTLAGLHLALSFSLSWAAVWCDEPWCADCGGDSTTPLSRVLLQLRRSAAASLQHSW
jgi:hypothetical protein